MKRPAEQTTKILRSIGVLIATLCFACRAHATIRYEVSLAHPEQHLFHVSIEVPDVPGELKLQMATWNALYQIRDFSSHVQEVRAFANGQPAPIEKLDKLTWRVQGNGTVTVKYNTFWDDVGPFNSQLNAEHAFINPAEILMYVPTQRTEKTVVALLDVPDAWKATVPAVDIFLHMTRRKLLALVAESFDELADTPIEASQFERFAVPDVSPPVDVVIHGDAYKKGEIESALRKIVSYEAKMMEGAPYKSYTFIFHVGKPAGGAGGGMEHANSTAIYVPVAGYLNNVSAHEFFHLWNVKRIRPASLEPVDYTREMYTRALWFAEGVTNTYASYTLVRTGLWSRQDFYQDLSGQITDLETRPAEQWQSAEQSSLDAWLEKYALYNQPQRSVSYYTKGQILGLLLDIAIRDRTENQHSLDDVLRAMNQDFAKARKCYRDSLDVRLEAEKVAGSSFEEFFARYVSGAEPLPYTDLLSRAGLALQQREVARAVLGFTVQREPNAPWTVASVGAGSNAEKSRLSVGDEIIAWNAGQIPGRPDRWAMQQKPGDELHLRVRRGGKEVTVDLRLGEMRETFYLVIDAPGADERARRIREGMLRGTTDAATARK